MRSGSKKPADGGQKTPGWIVSFTDMITLLLAFFVLLQAFAKERHPELFFAGLGIPDLLFGKMEKAEQSHWMKKHPTEPDEENMNRSRVLDAEDEDQRKYKDATFLDNVTLHPNAKWRMAQFQDAVFGRQVEGSDFDTDDFIEKKVKVQVYEDEYDGNVRSRVKTFYHVSQWRGEEASEAEAHFEKTVQNKEVPDEIEEFKSAKVLIGQLLVDAGVVSSRSEASRLIKQKAVSVNGEKVADMYQIIVPGSIVKAGKRRYIKITWE